MHGRVWFTLLNATFRGGRCIGLACDAPSALVPRPKRGVGRPSDAPPAARMARPCRPPSPCHPRESGDPFPYASHPHHPHPAATSGIRETSSGRLPPLARRRCRTTLQPARTEAGVCLGGRDSACHGAGRRWPERLGVPAGAGGGVALWQRRWPLPIPDQAPTDFDIKARIALIRIFSSEISGSLT